MTDVARGPFYVKLLLTIDSFNYFTNQMQYVKRMMSRHQLYGYYACQKTLIQSMINKFEFQTQIRVPQLNNREQNINVNYACVYIIPISC